MTTAELFAWGIPAMLVPLPTAAADHQTTNAVTLERAGAAIHIPQSQLTVERLDATVRRLLDDPAELAASGAKAPRRARVPTPRTEIARRILALSIRRGLTTRRCDNIVPYHFASHASSRLHRPASRFTSSASPAPG